MAPIEHLAQFHCPSGILDGGKAKIIHCNKHVYVCCSSRFLYVFSMEKRQITSAYMFPSKIWHIELVTCTHQLYVLCERSGLYLLELDEQGRLLLEVNPVISKGDLNIYHIGSNFVCLLDSSVCSFTVAYDFLVIVLVQQDKWKVKLFHRKASHYEDPRTSPSREVKFTHNLGPEISDLQPILCCVSLWKEKTMSGGSCNFGLDVSLFTQLFGVDLTMLETPMIICGFPDGQVICFPLRSTSSFMQTSETHSLPQSSLKILYQLEQPVLSIGATRTEPCDHTEQQALSSENISHDCLLFVGRKGLIVSVTSGDMSDGLACVYKDYRLSVPMYCALYSISGVYCSTYSDLMFVTIPNAEEEAASTASSSSIVSFVCSNIPMIVAVSEDTSLSNEVVVLSNRGRLLLCKVNQRGGRDRLQGMGVANEGQKIRELLSGIGSVSERISKLKSTVDQKASSLPKLNQVISLSRKMLSSHCTECPVHCNVRVKWTQVLQKDCLVAYCNLENKTDCFLEREWTLCILINTEPNISYSFPIALNPMEKTELAFPLTMQRCEQLNFPIKIFCTLFYSLQEHADKSISRVSSLPYLHKKNVSISLQEHTIDLLQCLRFSHQASFHSTSCTFFNLPENLVKDFLKNSFGGESSHNQLEAVSNKDVNLAIPLKALVQVSAHQLAQALQNEQSGRALCSTALHWLLSAELIKVQDLVEVQGVMPDGMKFCMHVQEVFVSDLFSDGNIPVIEVQILGFNLHVVASLHLAVITRLKLLLQQKKTNNGFQFPDLNLTNIQQKFSVYEMMLKEVKSIRDRLCMDEDTISIAASQRFLNVYRDLRESSSLLFI